MQVRVRRKNPLIERKITDLPGKAGTKAEASTQLPERASSIAHAVRVERIDPPIAPSMYDEEESSETTQEFELEDRQALVDGLRSARKRTRSSNKKPRVRAASPKMYGDEDATVVASEAPSMPSSPMPTPVIVAPKKVVQPPPRVISGDAGASSGAIPRNMLGKWGTKAVGAVARKAVVEKKAKDLAHISHPALRQLRAELSPLVIATLEKILSGDLENRALEASLSPKRSLEHLINELVFNELLPAERARILEAIAGSPEDITTIKAAIALLKSGVARRFRPSERAKLFETFGAFDPECRALLARLSARPLRSRSALEDRDFEDSGLVTHLHTLACGLAVAPAIARAGFRAEQIVSLVLSSVANPERLPFEEGADGVLSIIEYGLADCSPAELARLWIELVTGEMTARLAGEGELQLGEKLRANPQLRFSARETPIRLGLELLTALANPRRGGDRAAFVMPGGHGVDADVISRALALLYSVGFTVAAGAPTSGRHLDRTTSDAQRVPPVFLTLLYDRGERVFLFDHLDQEHVYIRAPHGRSSKRKGAQRTDPSRVVEDADAGLDKITRAELVANVGVALIPR